MTITATSERVHQSTWVEDWTPSAACRRSEPDALFVQGAAQQEAKLICQRCPVVAECLADALDNRTEFGVWGGMTERERRAILRRHPSMPSWRAVFQADRERRRSA
ncbi:MAG TPA: WhiB family transcriptional regulator [Dermatophilaceae bacterium]|nr:WhiB family transcriptional regulator [Dermatophilaceae bacterium]